MTKLEHLQFLVLMIPTFVVLGAAALSMADLLPADLLAATTPPPVVAKAVALPPAAEVWDDRPAP